MTVCLANWHNFSHVGNDPFSAYVNRQGYSKFYFSIYNNFVTWKWIFYEWMMFFSKERYFSKMMSYHLFIVSKQRKCAALFLCDVA